MGMDLKRTFAVFVAAFAAGLLLSACTGDADDEPSMNDEPSLSEIREFRAYPVYYAGTSVSGNALLKMTETQSSKRTSETRLGF
jgi:outer membrane biogenesis lipoprotein LolB